MEVKIHSEVKMNRDFAEQLQEKISRLDKFLPGNGRVDLYLRKEGPQYLSEITFHRKHLTIFLKGASDSLNESLDILLNKARTKLRRVHDKIIDKSHK